MNIINVSLMFIYDEETLLFLLESNRRYELLTKYQHNATNSYLSQSAFNNNCTIDATSY